MSPAREERSNTDHLSALIVDDNPIIRAILKRVLSSYSVDCDEARDGRGAVEQFDRRLQARRPYDMVCLDLGLPEMDGHTALLHMRAAENQFQPVVPAYIIVLTAEDDGQAVNQMFSDGASAYILKPFDHESFRSHIARILRQKSSHTKGATG
jgi:two-component system chemotaxis response regulator CheY